MMVNSLCFCIVFDILFMFDNVFGVITTLESGNYIGHYDSLNSYGWYEAEEYCNNNYGTSLASIHSEQDDIDVQNAFVTPVGYLSNWVWIGLNDIENESLGDTSIGSGWEYSDGTDYDYYVAWRVASLDGSTFSSHDCVLWWFDGENAGWEDAVCSANYYSHTQQWVCNAPIDELECINIEECNNDPCNCDIDDSVNFEDTYCDVCNSDDAGCSQCQSGYFKKDFNYPCVSCNEIFGDACMFCQDFNGCGQCITNYDRVWDEDCQLYVCQANPCADSNNHCSVCNNGECSQCESGYIKKYSDDTQCVNCQTEFGASCMHCSDYIGCQQCAAPSAREQNNDGFYECIV